MGILFVLSSLFFVIFPSQAYVREVFSALRARSFCSQCTAGCALRPWQTTYSIFSAEGPSLSFKKKNTCAPIFGVCFSAEQPQPWSFRRDFFKQKKKKKVSKQKQYAYSPCFGGLSV